MTLAIRGGQASSLSLQLAPGAWLLAVARGFGSVDGVAVECALLEHLRSECERSLRHARFRRAIERPQQAATAILSALARVNARLHVRTAGHDDYVTAASSLTVVLVVLGSAHVIHAGNTAAYLARGGRLLALSANDALDDAPVPLLARSIGGGAALDVTVSSTMLDEGDMIVLVGRRLRDADDRGALLERLDTGDPGERVLIARFERDAPIDVPEQRKQPRYSRATTLLVRAAAMVTFAAALVLAH